jgi:putative DNA-invertase from lambdoid prophage Rac
LFKTGAFWLYPRPIVAYLRVSTEKQDLESQRLIIETWAKSKEVIIDEWLYEVESGKEDQRPRFQELWERARHGRVGTIVVAELSRLSRRMRTLVNFLYDCLDRGVMVVSVRESWLEQALGNELTRPMIIAMLSTLYELERKMISERTKAGLAKARAQGKRIGRPRREVDLKRVEELKAKGLSLRDIARLLGVSYTTLRRRLREHVEKGEASW